MTETDPAPPESEHDWSTLKRALTDALWNEQLILPKQAEVALIAAVVDILEGEHATIVEADPQ
jgi:hypothetical protein